MTTSSGMNLVMTTIGFSVSTLFIVFVCTRLICARIHLRFSRRPFHLASRSDLSSLERGLHGLEPVLIANFPVKKYCDEYFSSAEDAQCTICLAEYIPEDVLRVLPHCGHYFHINCIDIWLLQHCTCPVCRISLRETNEKKRLMQPMFMPRSHHVEESASMHSHHCLMQPMFSSRSHHGVEQPPPHSHHCLLAGHHCQSRMQGNHKTVSSIQGNPSVSTRDPEEAGEVIHSVELGESGDGSLKRCENKNVDCPSSELDAC